MAIRNEGTIHGDRPVRLPAPGEGGYGALGRRLLRSLVPPSPTETARAVMPNAVARCGSLFGVAAVAGALAFAIIAFTGILPDTTVGAVLLGCGGFLGMWKIFVVYRHTKSSDDVPWMKVAGAITLQLLPFILPCVVAGTLGITGIASGATMGW